MSAPAKPLSLRFKIGLVLLLINTPFGYAGLAAGTALFARTGRFFWEAIGIGCYAVSWIMLGLGAWLAGPEGLRQVSDLWRKWASRFKRRP